MIFAALGTSPLPFKSVVKPLSDISFEYDLTCQCGNTLLGPHVKSIPYLSNDELKNYICSADVVIVHGGVAHYRLSFSESD